MKLTFGGVSKKIDKLGEVFCKKMRHSFGSFRKSVTFALAIGKITREHEENAEIAQLVEHNLAKVRVASSSLVFRSRKEKFARKAQVAEW